MYAVVGRWNMDQSPASEDQDHKLHDMFVPMVEVAPALFMAFKAPSLRDVLQGVEKVG